MINNFENKREKYYIRFYINTMINMLNHFFTVYELFNELGKQSSNANARRFITRWLL